MLETTLLPVLSLIQQDRNYHDLIHLHLLQNLFTMYQKPLTLEARIKGLI